MKRNIGLVDYGCGNIFSLKNAFAKIGHEVDIVDDPTQIKNYDTVVLPGIGEFGQAVRSLDKTGLFEALQEHNECERTLIGICLGMQLLFQGSSESPGTHGLCLEAGNVEPFIAGIDEVRLNVGWRSVHRSENSEFKGTDLQSMLCEADYYFVHEYKVSEPKNFQESTWAERADGKYLASFKNNNRIGFQFHPEKSGEAGLAQLRKILS